jgi:hypothetical protein
MWVDQFMPAKRYFVERGHEMKSGEWQKEGSLNLAAKIA